jgi:hypothetical protein
MFGLAHFPGEELIVEGHDVIQNRLVNFHEEAGRERIPFDVGKATKRMRIVPFAQISQIPNHGEADPVQIAPTPRA